MAKWQPYDHTIKVRINKTKNINRNSPRNWALISSTELFKSLPCKEVKKIALVLDPGEVHLCAKPSLAVHS